MMVDKTTDEMPFLEHVSELRRRIAFSAVSILLGSIACFVWSPELFFIVSKPLHSHFESATLIGISPAEAFIVKLKLALTAGILLSSPILFLQLWLFVSPALKPKEKRFAFPFIFVSTAFFLGGVTFCFYVILPYALAFFSGEFLSVGITPTIRIGEYLSFLLKMVLVFGIVFDLPVLCFLLARMGLVSSRWLLSKGRYLLVGIFVVAAILTPPDLVTQLLLALPLILIYGICIAITWLAERRTS